MKTVQFKEWKCNVHFETYINGGKAIVLRNAEPIKEDGYIIPVDADEILTATCWIKGLAKDEVAIKNYSENEGILPIFIDADIIEQPHRYVQTGFVKLPICKLCKMKK